MLERAVAEAFIGFKFPLFDNTGASAMNAFYEHHKDSIKFGYRCFDRILLNGLIQPFQQPQRVIGFLDSNRVGHKGFSPSTRALDCDFSAATHLPVLGSS